MTGIKGHRWEGDSFSVGGCDPELIVRICRGTQDHRMSVFTDYEEHHCNIYIPICCYRMNHGSITILDSNKRNLLE